jgi:heme/copper-type cytochrome/quinol oxidase subunit 3
MSDVIPLRRGPRSALLSATGMAVFLGSWAVSFVALFAMDLLVRARAPSWPPPGREAVGALLPAWLPLASTFDAVVSSLAAQRVLGLVRRGRAGAARPWLLAALGLALGFLSIQAVAWVRLRDAGVLATWHAYYGLFFLLTAFHAAHVLTAAALLGWLAPALFRGEYGARNPLPVQHVTWFWHFTTAAWLGTALLVYVA